MDKETKLTEMTEIYVKQMLLPKEELALQTMELMTDKMVLENNWNELKEWLKNREDEAYIYTKVLDKMEVIEGVSNE